MSPHIWPWQNLQDNDAESASLSKPNCVVKSVNWEFIWSIISTQQPSPPFTPILLWKYKDTFLQNFYGLNLFKEYTVGILVVRRWIEINNRLTLLYNFKYCFGQFSIFVISPLKALKQIIKQNVKIMLGKKNAISDFFFSRLSRKGVRVRARDDVTQLEEAGGLTTLKGENKLACVSLMVR